MRAGRFPSSFVVALCMHAGALAAVLLAVNPHAPGVSARALPADELVVVSEEPVSPVVEPQGAVSDRSRGTPPRVERSPAERIARARPESPIADVGEPAVAAPSPTSSAERPGAPRAPVDIGLGGYWKSIAMAAPPPAEARRPTQMVPEPPSVDKMMRDELDARDRDIGLGSGGPLVTAAHEAASLATAPDVGSATFVVECDANGTVTNATLVSASADDPGWQDVRRELMNLLASKKLHVPGGAHGVRVRLSIAIARTLPSGEHLVTAPGAVPDDVPGGGKACDGEGIHRRCFEHGMPVGVSGSWGDLSNIGQKKTRVVHARVVGEERR